MTVGDEQYTIEDSSEAPHPEPDERRDGEAPPGLEGPPPASPESPPDVEPAGTPPAPAPQPEVAQPRDPAGSTWAKVASIATAAGTLVAALAAVGALYFSNSTLVATNEQLGLAHRTAQTGQIKAAAEQLDSDKKSVRLSGIYLFERLAQDSESDRLALRRLLEAFVRTETTSGPRELPAQGPSADVQAALDVIATYGDLPGPTPKVNLRQACLPNATLQFSDLTDADLSFTNFTEATLDGTNLALASLEEANFTGASLVYTNLTDAVLADTNLTDAILGRANFTRAYLGAANLTEAFLLEANFTDATLTGANLTEAYLVGANFTGATLDGANLTGIVYDDSTRWPEGFIPPPSARR